MTNPTNAVEKPEPGCGCDGDPDGVDPCPLAADPSAEAKWQRWELARLAYQDHIEAAG